MANSIFTVAARAAGAPVITGAAGLSAALAGAEAAITISPTPQTDKAVRKERLNPVDRKGELVKTVASKQNT